MMLRALALLLVIANLALFLQGRIPDDDDGGPGSGSAAPPAVDAPRTLRLLEEVPVSEVPVSGEALPGMPFPLIPTTGSAARHCEWIGSFDTRDEAEAAAARAGRAELAARLQVRRVSEGTPDHQVYLPPLASLDRARLRVRELEALGIDSFVMGGDGLEGAISIGLFTSRQRAEARRDEVSGLGYEVRIRTLERTRERIGIRVRGRDAQAVEAFLGALEADHPDLERRVVDCEAGGERADPADAAIAPESAVT